MKTINTSVAPIRLEPSHRSEMISQVLYGEKFQIVEIHKEFSKIKMEFDQYEGWVANNQIAEINEEKTFLLNQSYKVIKGELLFCGSEINEESKKIDLIKLANSFLGAPYLWGGRTIAGIDCSGFIQIIYKSIGQNMPRDSGEQSKLGEIIKYGNHQEGDLAFFKENGKIMHVGLILNSNKIIHASGCVRVDSFTEKGIFTSKENMTHNLTIIKRIIR